MNQGSGLYGYVLFGDMASQEKPTCPRRSQKRIQPHWSLLLKSELLKKRVYEGLYGGLLLARGIFGVWITLGMKETFGVWRSLLWGHAGFAGRGKRIITRREVEQNEALQPRRKGISQIQRRRARD